MTREQSDRFFGNDGGFWELIAKRDYVAETKAAVKEAKAYEDEHGLDNWGAVIPNCPISAKAIEIIKNLK
jgi:hypothetical protein